MLEIDSVALLPAARKRHHSEVLLTPSYDVHVGFESVSRAMDDRHVARCKNNRYFFIGVKQNGKCRNCHQRQVPELEI